MVTIGITTFKERFHSDFVPLANCVAGRHTIVAVNASNKTGLCNEYRADMLSFMSGISNMSPIFYQQMRGLAKMWNDIIIHSPTEYILMLNDDVQVNGADKLMKGIEEYVRQAAPKMVLINNSWSHFLISKSFAIEVGWFDERLLGFGEEDGDMVHRVLSKGGVVTSILSNGIINKSSAVRDESVKAGHSKYTLFNRVFMGFMQSDDIPIQPKYTPYEHDFQGMFHCPMKNVLGDEKQYPYEAFFLANRDKV